MLANSVFSICSQTLLMQSDGEEASSLYLPISANLSPTRGTSSHWPQSFFGMLALWHLLSFDFIHRTESGSRTSCHNYLWGQYFSTSCRLIFAYFQQQASFKYTGLGKMGLELWGYEPEFILVLFINYCMICIRTAVTYFCLALFLSSSLQIFLWRLRMQYGHFSIKLLSVWIVFLTLDTWGLTLRKREAQLPMK